MCVHIKITWQQTSAVPPALNSFSAPTAFFHREDSAPSYFLLPVSFSHISVPPLRGLDKNADFCAGLFSGSVHFSWLQCTVTIVGVNHCLKIVSSCAEIRIRIRRKLSKAA